MTYQQRIVGDRSKAIAGILQRKNGNVMEDVDLTGETVEFSMYDAAGVAKVDQTSATVDNATAVGGAEVSYAPTANDVDTAGTYYGYFSRKDSGGLFETFPTEPQEFVIEIKAR